MGKIPFIICITCIICLLSALAGYYILSPDDFSSGYLDTEESLLVAEESVTQEIISEEKVNGEVDLKGDIISEKEEVVLKEEVVKDSTSPQEIVLVPEPKKLEKIDMIIFISPQYANDSRLQRVINIYIEAVKESIGWHTKILPLVSEDNDFQKIDRIIESYYKSYRTKAIIMVGEDIKTPLRNEFHGNQEAPFVATWADTNGEVNEYSCLERSCYRDFTPEVAISLMYPNSALEYTIKRNQLISAFNKFSQQKQNYGNEINVFMPEESSSGVGNKGFGSSSYGKLYLAGNINITIDPTNTDISDSLSKPWKIYAAVGHADPSRILTSEDSSTQFYSSNLINLNTALFLSTGCFTNGWFADSSLNSNNLLDPPITPDWYGNYIFLSPYIRTEFNGGQGSDFVYCAAEKIAQGETMAEIFTSCDRNSAGVVMFGDPSLRFKPFLQSASPALEVWNDDITTTGNAKINQGVSLNIKIRNLGNVDTVADVYIYDATNQPSLVGKGNSIYYARIDGKKELEICKRNSLSVLKNSFASFDCNWKPIDWINHIIVRVFNKGSVEELSTFDNGNEVIVIAN